MIRRHQAQWTQTRMASILPEKAADILKRLLDGSALGRNLEHVEVYSVWRVVAGAEIARHTRVAGLRGNVLRVEVDSSPWLYELAGFHKKHLLAGLSSNLKKTKVVDITFKIGKF